MKLRQRAVCDSNLTITAISSPKADKGDLSTEIAF